MGLPLSRSLRVGRQALARCGPTHGPILLAVPLHLHPEAEWENAATALWAGQKHWAIPPPIHAFGEAVSQLRASGAAGTLFSSLLCLMVASPWACPA